jgi:ABC-type nitrate/sulfonate/bicarbonate transport system ATPase subunit
MGSISLNKINKSFGATEVLKNIDLEISDGEFLILVGPSGCGKSTLMNLIAGLEDITSGEIVIDGKDISSESPKDLLILLRLILPISLSYCCKNNGGTNTKVNIHCYLPVPSY